MCGFSAILLKDGTHVSEEFVERMTAVLSHRGPDDSGTFLSGPVGLGFRRLAILDLSPAGHQPMTSSDGQVTVVFNGEIYNFVELRSKLTAHGHAFRSSGDTEVLLRAYLEWGSDCVKKFNGMWAFIIHDQRRRLIFGSRDRFGIKPLYVHSNSHCVLLGSEIKSIRSSGLYRNDTNWRAAARFLVEGQIDESAATFYADIRQVPAGTAFEIEFDGRYRQWQYWSLEALPNPVMRDPAHTFADLFEDAVRLHMRSDVPVGVHLSGGLDSTSIICASARLRNEAHATGSLMAFSYIAPEFDESKYVADTIAQTRATLVKLETTPTRLWELLNEVLWFQDEPIYSMMPLVSYELMRLAANGGVKVVLNGQGADETLGGYPSYFVDYWYTLLSQCQVREAWREIAGHVDAHGGNKTASFLRQLRRFARSRASRLGPYRKASVWNRRRNAVNRGWFTRELVEQAVQEDRCTPMYLNEALADSIYRSPLPRILRVEDRNSMAHSIEARLPFLDHRLVSLAFSLPADWRLRGPWNKFILRQAMHGRIPESIRTRIDKMGFPVPANAWVAGPLREPILDILNSRTTRERGIYNVDAIIHDVERHGRGEATLASEIFDVAQFEIWSTQIAHSAGVKGQ